MRRQGGRVPGNQPEECHTTWPEKLTNKKGGGEEVGRWRKEAGGKRDSDDEGSAKRRKKSGGTKSIEVSRWSKVAKVRKTGTGRVAAKGKKTLDYGSDDFSSSSDDSTTKATMGKHSVKELLEKIEEKN